MHPTQSAEMKQALSDVLLGLQGVRLAAVKEAQRQRQQYLEDHPGVPVAGPIDINEVFRVAKEKRQGILARWREIDEQSEREAPIGHVAADAPPRLVSQDGQQDLAQEKANDAVAEQSQMVQEDEAIVVAPELPSPPSPEYKDLGLPLPKTLKRKPAAFSDSFQRKDARLDLCADDME